MPSDKYIVAVAALAALVFLPALVAGAGFVVAIVLAVLLIAALLGVPLGYDLYKNKTMGERSGVSVRNMIAGDGIDPGEGQERP